MKREKEEKNKNTDKIIELLQNLVIIELGKLGVSQLEIRKIVGVDIYKVNKILKYLSKK